MNFGRGRFSIRVLNTGEVAHSMAELVPMAIDHLRDGMEVDRELERTHAFNRLRDGAHSMGTSISYEVLSWISKKPLFYFQAPLRRFLGGLMRLKKLTLSNYRKFTSYEVTFDDHVTVLVGGNGSGKSSLLDAASVALGSFLVKMDGASGTSLRPSDAHLKHYAQGSILDGQPQYPVTVSAEGIVRGKNVSWARSLRSSEGKTTIGDARELTSLSLRYLADVREGRTQPPLPIIAYYGTGRLWAQKRDNADKPLVKFNRLDGYAGCLDSVSNIKFMLAWFQKMTLQEFTSGERSPELAAVRGATEKCLDLILGGPRPNGPEGALPPDSRVSFNPDTHDLDVTYADSAGERRRDALQSMSDGYRSTLSMVADIAYRMALLNPALLDAVLETPGVVLIDEVDLHLHPLWQARILGDLRSIFPNIQFIVTTHAPMVISSVPSRNVRVLGEERAEEPGAESFGLGANDVLTGIMGAGDRQPSVSALFDRFSNQLAQGDYDASERTLSELEALVGDSNPDLAAARSELFFERL